MKIRFKQALLLITLASSLIACPNPPPINVIPPTVSISSPNTDVLTKGAVTVQLAVTGEPTTVELLKDGAVLATLSAPYSYTWDTTTETEKVYSLTARATKAGTADVTSAARQITVDRTAPTLVSRVPTDNSSNVLLTDEISLTFSEPILNSSITDTSVQLLNGANVLPRNTTLNANGTKLTLVLTPAPALPANMTVVVNGLTDLAGNTAVIANSSFAIPATSTAQSIELIVPALGITSPVTRPDLKILLKNFSNSRVTFAQIFLNGKLFATQDFASSCPELCVQNFTTPVLTSYFNGSYIATAKVTQADGTITLTQNTVNLGIGITNFYGSSNWQPVAPTNGGLLGIDTPSGFNNSALLGSYGDFVVANGSNNLILRKQLAYSVQRNQDHGLYLSAITGTRVPSNDKVVIRVRDCADANNCTIWNTLGGSNSVSPPYLGDAALSTAYMEIELDFLSLQAEGDAYIGNLFIGQY
jgi:Bacterial Ig-like domain/Bacterial Ig domain